MTSKQKGDINELRCMTRFVELGFTVSKPISENSRYDFVIENGGKFFRMQAKKSRYSGCKHEHLKFNATSVHYRRGRSISSGYTEKDIDYFCTENNGNVYVIPVGETNGKTSISITLKEGDRKNVNSENSRPARNYLAQTVFGVEDCNEKREDVIVIHKPNVKCDVCGKEMYRTRPNDGSFICIQCTEEKRRGIPRPTMEVLKAEIGCLAYGDISKKYKVSATTVRRWAKKYGIELPVKHRHSTSLSDNTTTSAQLVQ